MMQVKNMGKPRCIAAIGELLWDLLPAGPQLGGAPANFAAMLAQLSASAASRPVDTIFLVSRAGNDPLGLQARDQVGARCVRTDHISLDPIHSTGTVAVALDAQTGPSYEIHRDVAWEYVPETPQLAALAPSLDAICFGTLAQRAPVTRATLRRLVAATRADCLRVFDVNRREPDWTADAVLWGCAHATILKMNQEEVPHIAEAVGAPADERKPLPVAHFLLDRFPIEMVAITRGPEGSLLVTREEIHDHPGMPVTVADTIGAGDCFTAALTYYALRGCPLPALAEAANRWGAWAATQRGGMNFLDETTRRNVEDAIENATRA